MMRLLAFEHCDHFQVRADVVRRDGTCEFVFEVGGDTADLVIPARAAPLRTAGLWQATCFEAFILTGPKSYIELNFAPSGEWAAYLFAGYRIGMSDLDIAPPTIEFARGRLSATVPLEGFSGAPLNLTAVLEERDGTRSYWALAHPNGDRPDFHAPDCFVAKLP